METPIYGVLILDPSRHSPLELVKSGGAHLASGVGILVVQDGRNLSSYPREGPPSRLAVHPAKAHAGRDVRATQATRARVPAPHMKE